MNEKYANIILITILILAIAWIVYMFAGIFFTHPATAQAVQQTPSKTVTVGTTDPGSVEISLTPSGYANGRFSVDIATNTHSVDMTQFDIKQLTTLEYDGKTLHPIDSPQMQGHHVRGTLVFETDSQPKTYTITITGIPAVNERVFRWEDAA